MSFQVINPAATKHHVNNNHKRITVLTLNVNHVQNKENELINRRLPEVVCVQETYSDKLKIMNYTTHSLKNELQPYGLILLVRNDIKDYSELIQDEHNQAIKVKLNQDTLIIANIYMYHNNDTRQAQEFFFKEFTIKHRDTPIVAIGDWNSTPDDNNLLLANNHKKIHIKKPSRISTQGARNIDYAIICAENTNKIQTNIRDLLSDISDHIPIELDVQTEWYIQSQSTTKFNREKLKTLDPTIFLEDKRWETTTNVANTLKNICNENNLIETKSFKKVYLIGTKPKTTKLITKQRIVTNKRLLNPNNEALREEAKSLKTSIKKELQEVKKKHFARIEQKNREAIQSKDSRRMWSTIN